MKQLKVKQEKLERVLTQQLHNIAEEPRASLKIEQQWSACLEQELRSTMLGAELDRTGTMHKALDALRARALERSRTSLRKRNVHSTGIPTTAGALRVCARL